MFQIERQDKLLQYINKKKKATIDQLADELGVSKVTVRRDISAISEKGLIIKTHGGVMALDSSLSHEIPFANKSVINIEEKKRIGRLAASLIEDKDIIILDSGSTTLEVAKSVEAKEVTALTHDINIATESIHKNNINLIVSGGVLDKSVYTLTGNQTVDFYRKVHVNKTFLGCDAIDFEFGISNRTMEEVGIKRAIMDSADEIIVVTDSSKFSRRVFFFLCDVSSINKLVIDKIKEIDKNRLEDRGVEVLIAD